MCIYISLITPARSPVSQYFVNRESWPGPQPKQTQTSAAGEGKEEGGGGEREGGRGEPDNSWGQ